MRLGKTWTILIIAQVRFRRGAVAPGGLQRLGRHTGRDGRSGFAAEEFLSAQLGMDSGPGTAQRRPTGTREFTRRFAGRQTELMRRLEAEPRVSGVTFAMVIPGDERNARIETEACFPSQSGAEASGSASRSETEVREVRFNRVDVNFFRIFEVPILAGRGFEPADIAPPGGSPK